MRRRLLVAGVVVLAVVVSAVVAFAFVTEDTLSDQAEQDRKCCWKRGATPRWMSETMGLRIPAAAADGRAGYKTSSRYDIGILAFTLPSREADAYLSRLVPEDEEMVANLHPEQKGYEPMAPFAHLGLPEPETLVKGMRRIGFCPDGLTSPEGKRLRYCVDLFAHEFTPGSTRVYVRSTIEPGVTPPAPTGPGA
ncbi:hypothetical protein SAZ11_20485 [Streptomyces sp. FXJ1.4098]|uniref:hypothetical protein n=1 Tax=Streptomyces sp. NPDC020845 TaxID=3365096 RepID=UPI002996B479|nr:hypothetical protein [Streptomyces sp. FXJ1.4098]